MGLRSTVVAPSRERICMLSWVAMERIYEREVLPDAKLRKQAGARPLRVHAKHLTDGELLAKLCSFGIEMDRTWLERECERALSAQEIAGPLMDQSESRGLESDWIWICVVTLWRRLLPDQPSFEELDDQRQAGYELLKTSGAVAACRIWLEAWHDVLRLLDKAGIESIEEFDDRFRGTQSLCNWIQDLESELWNAGLEDRQFLSAGGARWRSRTSNWVRRRKRKRSTGSGWTPIHPGDGAGSGGRTATGSRAPSGWKIGRASC